MAAAKKAGKAVAVVAAPVPVLTTAQKCDAIGIDVICERIADCVPLRAIAADIGISASRLMDWLADNHVEQYARARAAQADKHAEDILAIADELEVEGKFQGEDFRIDVSSSAVARNRLRVDARRWLASKMNSKKYGDKVTNEVTGAGGGAIEIVTRVELVPMVK